MTSGKIKTKRANKKRLKKNKSAPKKSARRHLAARTSAASQRNRPAPARISRASRAKQGTGELFEDLVALQARLRAPGGCPWDRQQTHATLQTYLIEETYEVLDALQNGNPKEMADELGDLLLQVLFHADLAKESGSFDISDVITGIHNKMVRRHPHVFGNVKADTPEEVLKNWAQLKAAEKRTAAGESVSLDFAGPSILESVSRSLPALLEAYQLSRKASRVGFDWESVEGIFEKLREESLEIREAMENRDRQHQVEEVGDLLFVAANLARFLGIDPEVALKHANLKFKNRFANMESVAHQHGEALDQLSKEELESLWENSKTSARLAQQRKLSS